MSYSAVVYSVMIASPSDVTTERDIAREVIHEWNAVHSFDRKIVLQPIAWETDSAPSMDARPQAVINKQILERADLLIAIFWTRLGTRTDEASSGTVEEMEKHMSAGKPAMIYFSSTPVVPESVDSDQYAALKSFREDCQVRGLIEKYDSPKLFKEKLGRQLAFTLNTNDYFALVKVETTSGETDVVDGTIRLPSLSSEARELLIQASLDKEGYIFRFESLGGLNIQTNGREFVEQGSPRSLALWDGALKELIREDLLQDSGQKGEIYRLTGRGYGVADLLISKSATP